MKILSLSDKIVSFIYSPIVRRRFPNVDLIIGCGDLSYYYLEYVMNALDVPLFFVRGNHDVVAEYDLGIMRTGPQGGTDLHRRTLRYKDLLLAGVEGSPRYRPGRYQYSQAEMWGHVFSLVPGLMANRASTGRYLDVFVTHAAAAGIHDRPDLPHQGIKAFRWLIKVFKPACLIHGHVHIYNPESLTESKVDHTLVINTFGFKEVTVDPSRGSQHGD
jgi:Icc-related predicted phosphoesterase